MLMCCFVCVSKNESGKLCKTSASTEETNILNEEDLLLLIINQPNVKGSDGSTPAQKDIHLVFTVLSQFGDWLLNSQ